ncbi:MULTISPECIES: type I-E CRISPR-associated endoribonuclease Cas2e [Corynebacterium]|uniref:CRISPR-associated protein n=1 Tax=Corynebacterium ramonii TaxID=3026968 RepID=A0ABM5RPA9_9CORY|nr:MULTISPECIES: type I-E CRISPR-associated endoribonuclease Cas2e [Corynebacterium]AIU31638.1 CRISPR-associated protein [Corynebacterium ramonii FRC0011]STC80310.1 CRISPR-associated protein [Corynebacterium ulcerans]
MFAVIQGHNLPNHLNGYLSRFFSEVDAGLYVGVLSRAVMENLWEKCQSIDLAGSLTLIHPQYDAEQGFRIRTTGKQRRPVVDIDGLFLSARGLIEDVRFADPLDEADAIIPDEVLEDFCPESE